MHPFLNGIADRPIGGERVYKGGYSGRSQMEISVDRPV
jgi:hypothetical protein